MRALWIGLLTFASFGCGEPYGETELADLEQALAPVFDGCNFARPGQSQAEAEPEVEEKRVLPKYLGFRQGTTSPCYGVPQGHGCLALPYTKTFTWHWGQSMGQYLGMLDEGHLEGIAGFESAMENFSLYSGTGFTFTQVGLGGTGLDNDITIEWSWNPAVGASFGQGGCSDFRLWATMNAPDQVSAVGLYDSCDINFNVPAMSTVVQQWAGVGSYAITHWDVGWAVAIHEFGHIMGLAHSVNGIMKAQIPQWILDNPGYTVGMNNALTAYNPNGAGFSLVTIPGFTPHTSE